MKRIEQKFLTLKNQKKCAFVAYLCGGDPDYKTSLSSLKILAQNGADIIEIGVPFLDPAGDGPTIENASKRAIKNGMDLKKTLQLVSDFRQFNQTIPIILMTYFNPLFKFGLSTIFKECASSGVDGILIVDLPYEEESPIIAEISANNLDLIRLIAPTTSDLRIKKILNNASGFVYLISMLGITGTKLARIEDNIDNYHNLRKLTDLPIVIGFGIQNEIQAHEFSKIGTDGVVIGSAIVKEISENLPTSTILQNIEKKVAQFCKAIKS